MALSRKAFIINMIIAIIIFIAGSILTYIGFAKKNSPDPQNLSDFGDKSLYIPGLILFGIGCLYSIIIAVIYGNGVYKLSRQRSLRLIEKLEKL